MALYVKQDFNPPILSRKWLAMKFRPNMLLYSREHIISILESGLLFREDSIEVEQETLAGGDVWAAGGGGWLTAGERVATAAALCVCLAACPLQINGRARANLLRLATYASIPVAVRVAHRRACRGSLSTLLGVMRDYLALARRAAACLKECAALRADLGSVTSVIECTRAMLCRQQSEMAVSMSRSSASLLGNAPWLRADLAWDAVRTHTTHSLMQIHHAFLVVQSTLLKHIAMAHYIPSANARKLYKNHNERIYWIHHTLINHLIEEFTQNYQTLERMYRLLKNYGNSDTNINKKKLGSALTDCWLYSDVHSDIARANLELKAALNKCNNLDAFLDSCAMNKQEINLEILSKDIDTLIGNITKCLASSQSSQIRLKKLLNKFGNNESEPQRQTEDFEDEKILKIEDKEPEVKDEVFYFVRTDEDDVAIQPSDVTTGPGTKEKEATKVVLNELRRKLVKREDVMRERERQALVKTMPEFKNNVPEFDRQIKLEEVLERKGYMSKLPKRVKKERLFRQYKIDSISNAKSRRKYRLKTAKYENETEINWPLYEANSKLKAKSRTVSFSKNKNLFFITEWLKKVPAQKDFNSDISEVLSDEEFGAKNANLNNNYKGNTDGRNFRFSKKDLELSSSSTDSDSDFDSYREQQMALLKDMRRYRASRKKKYPSNKAGVASSSSQTADEGLRPLQYSFGAGLAMASVLQVNSGIRANMPQEETFIGDGELSQDSGNDEDN